MNSFIKFWLGFILLSQCGMITNVLAVAVSTFDTGVDSWVGTPAAEHSWSPTGGNTDGYIRFEDVGGSSGAVIAPAAFLGDYSGLDGTGVISFDHKLFSTGFIGNNGIFPYSITLTGNGGGIATWEGAKASGASDWVTVTASLIETEWDISGVWLNILSDVTELRIRTEIVDNDASLSRDIVGIDNIRVSSVPIPATIWLFGSGVIGLFGFCRKRKLK